jgi:hypothetical protein
MTSAVPTPAPGPVVQVSATPDPDRERAWWAWWTARPVVERRRPAAEVLAEVREDDA